MCFKLNGQSVLFKVSTFVQLFLLYPSWSYALEQLNYKYSVSEGIISENHVQDFNQLRQKYFYTDGRLDKEKMTSLKFFLEKQILSLKDSAKLSKKYNLINEFGYSGDKATKKGIEAQSYEETEVLAPFYFALEQLDQLIGKQKTLTNLEIHERVENILLFYSVGYTIHPEGVVINAVDRLKNVFRNFLSVDLNESHKIQASNLLDSDRKKFLTSEEISIRQRAGQDISKFDPPSSAFWINNSIEEYNPRNEIYYGEVLFPDQSIDVPEFFYERMGNGNIKIKTHWFDSSELNKKGLPKKKDVTIRLGHEVHTTPASSHFARILGYHANPNTFRKKIKLNLNGISYEQFTREWLNAHALEQGSTLTHIERIPGDTTSVYIKNANLEAYPDSDKYRKMGAFRVGDNGYNNRREYRTLMLYLSLISMSDQFEYQSRSDAFRLSKNENWKPIFFISDVGQSLGMPTFGNPGAANEFYWKFTHKTDEKIYFYWMSIFDSKTWEQTTYSDLKWMARRIARIKSEQIDTIFTVSGFPKPVAILYSERMKSRINQLISDFKLDLEGFKKHHILSLKELQKLYPDFIDSNGYLRDAVQQYDNNTAPLLGKKYTPWQAIKSGLYKAILNSASRAVVDQSLNPKLTAGLTSQKIDEFKLESGALYSSKRDITINSEVGPDQRRYLVSDQIEYGLPLGIVSENVETPFALYKVYNFTYIFSVDSLEKAASKRFFNRFNPFELKSIKENMSQGERLVITESYGASIGRLKIQALDRLKIDAALLGISTQYRKIMYFSKTNDVLELFLQNIGTQSLTTGFDLEFQLRLAFQVNSQKNNSDQKYYKIDLNDFSYEQQTNLQKAYDKVLYESDMTLLNQSVSSVRVANRSEKHDFKLAFLLWEKTLNTQISELKFDDQKFITAQRSNIYDQSFDRLWSDRSKIQNPSLINGLLQLTNEDQGLDILLETKIDDNAKKLTFMELNISITRSDLVVQKEDLKEKFFDFFNTRYGQKNFIQFTDQPALIKQQLNLFGLMRWQLNQNAILKILDIMSDPHQLKHLIRSEGTSLKEPTRDQRQYISLTAQKLITNFNQFKDSESIKNWIRDYIEIFNMFIGMEASYVSEIRKHVSENDIWIVTTLEDLLADTHPTMRFRNHYWAPEVGRFQGHSELNHIRRTRLIKPILVD